jgi:hypothetical protein
MGRPEFRPKEFSARTFDPVLNECEGECVPILPSKTILIGPKVRTEIHVIQNYEQAYTHRDNFDKIFLKILLDFLIAASQVVREVPHNAAVQIMGMIISCKNIFSFELL